MLQSPDSHQLELVYIIANYGTAEKIVVAANKLGAQGATVLLGRGTAASPLLRLLDLSDIRKEIILMLFEQHKAYTVMKKLSEQFHFDKPNHGITFSIPVTATIGAGERLSDEAGQTEEEERAMYQAIFVIVDRGRAEDAIEAASQAGARGGTIFHARGAGAAETSTLFSMEIEPEKEIALIITNKEKTKPIVDSVAKAMGIEDPAGGIIFVQDVSLAYGLY